MKDKTKMKKKQFFVFVHAQISNQLKRPKKSKKTVKSLIFKLIISVF